MIQLAWLNPDLHAVLEGFVPRASLVTDPGSLYLAVGIVGATVMPHNLYLHSSLVQRLRLRALPMKSAIRYASMDSTIALTLAFFINAALLVVAAGAFHAAPSGPVIELAQAYRLLSPTVGVAAASTLFGIALICAGLSASVTGTLAGQVVMEGFLDIRVAPATRALLTRLVAIVPAIAITARFGNSGANALLVFSQVVLSLQLPFAVLPLVFFVTRRRIVGEHVFGKGMSVALWAAAGAVVALNLWLVQSALMP